jgi:hypothetical protein
VEIDRTPRGARIEAGVFGPTLEAQLKLHALDPAAFFRRA